MEVPASFRPGAARSKTRAMTSPRPTSVATLLGSLAIPMALATSALVLGEGQARADEGMWPFDMVPRAQIKKTHGVDLSEGWLDDVRLASVRFNSGGSGSFVSAKGLVLTNHHVASDCIAKLARPDHDYLETGYVAGKDGPEVPCPDLELNQLVAIEDVTEKVQAAKAPTMNDAEANVAMKGAMSALEKACAEKSHMRCDVVTLYAGGKYHLYTYKKFTDVRLVFAPEQVIAFFGGDPDNFTYPRYDLDMAVFRVYEGGQPVKPAHHLTWNGGGPKEGETVFVSGHPGSTGRMQTVAQLQRLRDTVYPHVIDQYERERSLLKAYAKTSKEAARETRSPLFGVENGLKAIKGFQAGLKDAALMKQKVDGEAQLTKAIEADAKLKAAYGTVFTDMAKLQGIVGETFKRHQALEVGARGTLFRAAVDLVRLPAEREVPNEKRLREYRDSALDSLRLRLFSPAPVYGPIDALYLQAWMERLQRDLGQNDPLVVKILAGRTPARAAQDLVVGTKLSDVNARRRLEAGGKAAVEASTDPMIVLARTLDAEARAARKRNEDEIEAPGRRVGERVAQAVFAVRGTGVAPDATFTLRLSTGKVLGYRESGKVTPWTTDFGGLYAHATGKDPYRLPPRWTEKKASLDPKTPFNFASTNDIIGGNSGSPVVNAAGQIVGLIFDGNLSSLPNRFVYGETTQRAVSVSTAAMTEALKKVYDAQALATELTGADPAAP